MTRLFPEGSGGKPSEARPEIWTDFATFLHFAERLGRTAEMLARAADDPGEDIALPRKWEEVAMGPGMMGGGGPRADMGPGAMMGEADRGRGMMRGEGPGLTAAGARMAAVRARPIATFVISASALGTNFLASSSLGAASWTTPRTHGRAASPAVPRCGRRSDVYSAWTQKTRDGRAPVSPANSKT